MDGYELKIKLDDFKPEISRTILIPKKLFFNELCNILEIILEIMYNNLPPDFST